MTMPGNPHCTVTAFQGTDAEGAQVSAVHAVAFEQRTANLVALYGLDDSELSSEDWREVRRQILDRLGLAD